MTRRKRFHSHKFVSDLDRLEALLDALAARLATGNRHTAARVLGLYDQDLRAQARAKKLGDSFAFKTSSFRRAEIDALLAVVDGGWNQNSE